MMFSEKLKRAMQQLGITQRQVVGMTGIGKSSVSQYLSGKNVPTEARQRDIARSLGLDADYFTQDDDPVVKIVTRQSDDGMIQKLDVTVAAKILQMNHNTVRKGLQQGVFPWGYAIHTSEKHWVYFINAKRFAEIEGGERMTKSEQLVAWAKTQKRVTNGYIKKKFGVDEEAAQEMYNYLKMIGIVGTMGYVLNESEEKKHE